MYFSASNATLKILNPIVGEALRLAASAFKPTPVDSLYIRTNEMPLQQKIKMLSARYFMKT